MGELNMNDIHQKLERHNYEIEAIKASHGELIESLKESTKSMQGLSMQFAVYVEKHDTNQKEIASLKAEVKSHSEKIAFMYPVVESLRGIVWKIGGSVIVGIGSSSAIVAILSKVN